MNKKERAAQLLARLQSLQNKKKGLGSFSRLTEDLLSKEIRNISSSIRESSTITALDKLGKLLSTFENDFDLNPILESVKEIERDLDLIQTELSNEFKRQIRELDTKISRKDDSGKLERVSKQLTDLSYEIENVQKERKLISDTVSKLGKLIDQVSTSFDSKLEKTSDRIEKVSKNTSGKIEEIEDEVEKLRTELISRIANVQQNQNRGGSMNRKITIGGTDYLTRYTDINFVAGSNISITAANDDTNKRVNITIASSGGGGGFNLMIPTGDVDGVNRDFVFSFEPSVIVVDEGRVMVATTKNGVENWTGTTNVTLTVPPNFDIFGY